MSRLARETDNAKIAVVLDNARFHHAKALTSLYEPGEALERITPIYLPPYAPDHNPTEHVWNAAKGSIANIQRDTPEQTYTAFIDYINLRLRLRTPTNNTTRKRSCLKPAMVTVQGN